jgi:hypothetical protein
MGGFLYRKFWAEGDLPLPGAIHIHHTVNLGIPDKLHPPGKEDTGRTRNCHIYIRWSVTLFLLLLFFFSFVVDDCLTRSLELT